MLMQGIRFTTFVQENGCAELCLQIAYLGRGCSRMPSCSNDWPWWLGGHRNAKNNQDKPPILRPDLLNTQAPTRGGGHRVL